MKVKSVVNKIYSVIKAVAICLVLIAALGVIYQEFIEDNIDYSPLTKNTLVAESTMYDGVNSNSIDSYPSLTSDYSTNTSDYNNEVTTNKIIYNSSLSLNTYSFDDTLNKVNNIIDEYDMTLIDDNYRIYNHERSDYLYLRVKSSELDNAIDKLKELGNVVSFNKNALNVDKQYTDIQSRIDSLETQLQRFYNLLNSSDSVSDLSNIYSQIDYLETQLEYARKSLENIDDDITYSTISLTITDVHRYNDDGTIIDSEGFIDNLIYSLGDSWIVFANFILGAIIALVYLLPFLLFIGIIVLIIRLFNKKKIHNKNIEYVNSDKDERELQLNIAAEEGDIGVKNDIK